MALSDDRILELAGLAPNRRVCASTCMARKIDKKPCQCYPGMRNDEALALARAIEAEVRKDDEALIRQMLGAVDLGKKLALTGGVFTPPELALLTAASTAARARLEKAP